MSEVLGTSGNDLTITIPSSGDTDWATSIRNLCFQVISDHKHEASGDGAKIRGYLGISFTDALIPNNTAVLARNAAGTGTVEVMKVNASDQVVFNGAAHVFDDDVFKVVDEADSTKSLVLSLGGATTAKGMTLVSSHTDDRTLTLPDATDTLVGKATTDVLTNKTLTSPVLTTPQINDTSSDHQYVIAVSELVADRTVTLPLLTGADEFVFKDHAVTLTNKTITSAANTLTIDADAATVSNIANTSIKAAAAIAVNKLAAVTASRALVSDGSGFIAASSVTATELGYVSGVTSSIQTQLGAKLDTTITNTGDIIYSSSGATASRLGIGSSGQVLAVSGGVPAWATNTASPVATLAKTTTYTATTADDVILCDTSGGAYSITLYAASGNSGRKLTIKKTTSDTTPLTIDGNASETIDGATTTTINTQYESVDLVCDGSNWHISNRHIPSVWTNFAPVFTGFGTTTGFGGRWRRVEENIEIACQFVAGTTTAVAGQVDIPLSLVIATASIPGTGTMNYPGEWIRVTGTSTYHSAGNSGVLFSDHTDTTSLYFSKPAASSANMEKSVASSIAASGDGFVLKFSVPISGWKG